MGATAVNIAETLLMDTYFTAINSYCTPYGLRIYLNDVTTGNLTPTSTPVALSGAYVGSIYTTDYDHEGVHYLYVEPYLLNYPAIVIATPVKVQLTITGCPDTDVTLLAPNVIPDLNWDLDLGEE